MRRVLAGDVLALADVIAGRPDAMAMAGRLIDQAHAAHHAVKRTGRPHPRWGNGSLMARCLAAPAAAPATEGTADWLCALVVAARALAAWRHRRS